MQTQELDPEVLIKRATDAGFSKEKAIALLKQEGIIKPDDYKYNSTKEVSDYQEAQLKNKIVPDAGAITYGERKTQLSNPEPVSIQSILSKIQPLISGLAGAGGTGLALSSGVGAPAAGLAGSTAMAGTDYVLNKFLGNEQSHPITGTLGIPTTKDPLIDSVTSIGENTLTNEAFGRIVGPILKRLGNTGINLLKESDVSVGSKPASSLLGTGINKTQATVAKVRDYLLGRGIGTSLGQVGKGSVSGDISKFEPTLSQYLESQGKHTMGTETIENLFAGTSKIEALKNSANLIKDEANDVATKVTRSKISVDEADKLANRVQLKVQLNSDDFKQAIIDNGIQIKSTQAALAQNPTDKALLANLNNLLTEKGEILKADLTTFNAPSKTRSIKDLLVTDAYGKSAYDPNPILDKVLYDHREMQRLFETGEIKVGGQSITSNSPRKDLAGYGFQRMFTNSTDKASGVTNFNKLINEWDKYKVTTEGKQLYNAQARNDIDQFYNVARYVSDTLGDKGASRYLTLRAGTATAALGSGLVTGMLGGTATGLATSGTIVGGVIALNQIGKLMTNPDVARLMIAAVSNGPLNMAPQVATRLLSRAMRGYPMKLEVKDANGKISQIEGKINAEGKFVETANMSIYANN